MVDKAAAGAAPSKKSDDSKAAAPKPAARSAGSSKEGPRSSIKTGVGSTTGASAGGEGNFEGRNSDQKSSKSMNYDVQCHTDEKGLEILRVSAESGDEAAQKALAQKGYKGVSIRGVTPVSDPDPNSLGGERDASIMIANAENPIGGADPLGDEHNREAIEKLGRADISELGE